MRIVVICNNVHAEIRFNVLIYSRSEAEGSDNFTAGSRGLARGRRDGRPGRAAWSSRKVVWDKLRSHSDMMKLYES